MAVTVSIIIPIYNARKFIRCTAGDILRQTYRDFEVIFVDDGSVDGTGRILDRLALKDERVRVIHQENGGTARARNAGIAASSGQELMVMDDDDRIPKGYVQEYVSAIGKTDADIIMGGYQRVTPEGRVLFTRRLVKKDFVPDEPGWLAYINISPWAKIYRRSFVEESGAKFLEYSYGEDIYFHMMLLAAHPKIGYSSSVSYRWIDHKESISNTIHKGIRQEADIFPMLEKVLEIHPERDDCFRYFMYRHCAYHIYVSGRDARREVLEEEFSRCRSWLKEHDLIPKIGPMSGKLSGETFRDRIAVLALRMTSDLHLEKMFAKLYSRDSGTADGTDMVYTAGQADAIHAGSVNDKGQAEAGGSDSCIAAGGSDSCIAAGESDSCIEVNGSDSCIAAGGKEARDD